MAENNINAYCSICGKGYHLCYSCSNMKTIKPWRSVTDTIECYKIYLALHGYTLSKDKDTAKKELENCDLTELQTFNPKIKSTITEIMEENKKIKYVSRKTKESVESETENIDE